MDPRLMQQLAGNGGAPDMGALSGLAGAAGGGGMLESMASQFLGPVGGKLVGKLAGVPAQIKGKIGEDNYNKLLSTTGTTFLSTAGLSWGIVWLLSWKTSTGILMCANLNMLTYAVSNYVLPPAKKSLFSLVSLVSASTLSFGVSWLLSWNVGSGLLLYTLANILASILSHSVSSPVNNNNTEKPGMKSYLIKGAIGVSPFLVGLIMYLFKAVKNLMVGVAEIGLMLLKSIANIGYGIASMLTWPLMKLAVGMDHYIFSNYFADTSSNLWNECLFPSVVDNISSLQPQCAAPLPTLFVSTSLTNNVVCDALPAFNETAKVVVENQCKIPMLKTMSDTVRSSMNAVNAVTSSSTGSSVLSFLSLPFSQGLITFLMTSAKPIWDLYNRKGLSEPIFTMYATLLFKSWGGLYMMGFQTIMGGIQKKGLAQPLWDGIDSILKQPLSTISNCTSSLFCCKSKRSVAFRRGVVTSGNSRSFHGSGSSSVASDDTSTEKSTLTDPVKYKLLTYGSDRLY